MLRLSSQTTATTPAKPAITRVPDGTPGAALYGERWVMSAAALGRFLAALPNDFSHPDYPLLVPLNFDYAALLGGGWSDRWLGLLFVAWGAALTLIARSLAARETTPFFAALLTLTVAPIAFSGRAAAGSHPASFAPCSTPYIA